MDYLVQPYFQIILLGIFSVGMILSANAQSPQDSEFNINDPLFRETLGMDSYSLQVGDETYNVYYEFVWDYNDDGTFVKFSSISLDPENKSLVMNIENIKESKYLDVIIPNKLLSAEDYKYNLIIDGVEKGYEIDWFPEHTVLGLIVPVYSSQIEIIGTHVVPEFDVFAILILGLSVLGLVYFTRKLPLGDIWTRAN